MLLPTDRLYFFRAWSPKHSYYFFLALLSEFVDINYMAELAVVFELFACD